MGCYAQLTQEQRYQIHGFMKAGFNQSEIAEAVGVHWSTASREFRRNQGQRGYRPAPGPQAHAGAPPGRRDQEQQR